MLMKKKALALIIFFALMFSLFSGAKAVQSDYGEFEGLPYTPPIVTLLSPSSNESYTVSDVPLNVTVQIRSSIFHNVERVRWLNYSLDGAPVIPLTLIEPSMNDISQLPYPVYGNDMLTGLSDGSHSLTIFGETFVSGLNGYFNETVLFTVDTSNTTEITPFPTELAIASVVIIAVFAVFLVYLRKRKH
jgi:hypothetical protein